MSSIAASDGTVPPTADQQPSSLGRRVRSALVLAPIALACMWFGGVAFWILVLVLAVLLAWEWNRLYGGANAPMLVHGATAVAALAVGAWGPMWLALCIVGGGALLAWVTAFATDRRIWWAFCGVLYLVLPCLALLWLRNVAEPGREWTLWLLGVIWATDTGAYFVGRGVGGPKLAPRVSPKKTWAGLIGGMASAALVGVVLALIFDFRGLGALAAGGVIVAVVSQIGDLTESAIKRHFRVKDSSHLIPGHGGVLDRLDGLLFATPALALVLLITGGEAIWR